MKKLMYSCLFGAFACSSLVAMFSPQAITWYFTPPADMVISCRSAVEWGIDAYRKSVLIAGFAGLLIGAAFFYFFRRNKPSPA